MFPIMSNKASLKLFGLTLGTATMLYAGLVLPICSILAIQKTVELCGGGMKSSSEVGKLVALRRHREAQEEIFRTKKLISTKAKEVTKTQIELSSCMIMVGEYDKAIKVLSKPYFPVSALSEANRRLLLSQAYISTSRYREAVDELKAAERLIPPKNSMREEIRFELGKAYLGANDLRSSAQAFEELRLSGGNPRCIKVYLALLNARTEPSDKLMPVVIDLLSFWKELPLEAVPNTDFLANYCSEIGYSQLSRLIRTSVHNVES